MRRGMIVGALIGMALACAATRKDCEEFACDDCRICATASYHGCRDLFRACELSLDCVALDGCIADCSDLVGHAAIECERECRYAHPNAEALYDDRFDCLDEVCARTCE